MTELITVVILCVIVKCINAFKLDEACPANNGLVNNYCHAAKSL